MKNLSLNIYLEAYYRKGCGGRSNISPPPLTLFLKRSKDISFKDDVSVILPLGISFRVDPQSSELTRGPPELVQRFRL
jgi:hypothetical protein